MRVWLEAKSSDIPPTLRRRGLSGALGRSGGGGWRGRQARRQRHAILGCLDRLAPQTAAFRRRMGRVSADLRHVSWVNDGRMLARHRRFGRRFDFAAVGCVRELASCMCRARGNNAHTARARPLRLPLSLRRDMAQIGFRAGGGRCGRYGRRFDFSTVSRVRELASCMCRARGEGAHAACARHLRLPVSLRRDMAKSGSVPVVAAAGDLGGVLTFRR